MSSTTRLPYGVPFGASLVLSVIGLTALAAAMLWSERTESATRLVTLGSLWLFTVAVPVVTAMRVHRAVAGLVATVSHTHQSVAELTRLRPLLVLAGGMALLNATALIYW